MKPSTRILLAGVAIEAMLAALGMYLVMQISSGAMATSVSPAEAKATITSVLGAVILLKRRGS
jgi:hypothetical protein